MSSTDWEEIKKLAADLQRAQLATSLQKLSENNCVEIINKLIEKNLLEVYFTNNGKEYITPSQLTKEIKDELFVNRGRISLTDLSEKLEVSLNVIQEKAAELAESDNEINFVLGQLISEDYLDIVAEEINEKLQQNGLLGISSITLQYDLPGDFLMNVIAKRLGSSIHGQQDESDPQTIYTEYFISRHKYQIRGVLSAITQPTPVSSIISRFHFHERLFFRITEKFISSGEVSGVISGAKSSSQAVYIPSIYSRAQYQWIESFLKQNGYLDFEALQNRGIYEPENYIRKNFKDQKLTYVPGACISQLFIDQIDANLDDALVNDGFVDIYPFLPSAFSGESCRNLINLVLETREANAKSSGCCRTPNCKIFCDSIVVTENLITRLSLELEKLMPSKAKEAIAKGAFKHQLSNSKTRFDDDSSKNKKEERRKKAAGGKSGGGTQGRETKTKSTKNKLKNRKAAHDSDDENDSTETSQKSNEIEFLSLEDLQEEISKDPRLEDCPEELLEEMAKYLHEPLTAKFQEIAKSIFLDSLTGGGDMRKKSHQQLQEKIGTLLITIRLAEKATKEFGEDTRVQLCKYLLRTYCSEILNDLVTYLADDSQIQLKKEKELSPEFRLKIINQLEDDMKKPLLSVHKTLTGAALEQYLNDIDDALAAADMMFKKKDNKKDRQILLNHRSGLVEQLNASLNSALSLHLSCLIIFQVVTGNILHASGKFVPQILMYLKPHLPSDFYELLHEYQNLVMKSLTSKEGESSVSILNSRLEELTPRLKEMTIAFKKGDKSRENSLSEV